ncbi:MAG: hypothetical protein ACKO13_04460 [Cytophagales bacterium]
MNKRRLLFLSVFGTYHLASIFVTIFVEANKGDLSLLYSLFGKIAWFKYGTFFGLVLFVAEVIWTWRDSQTFEKEKEAMRHENNVLKAKVYDLTDGGKKSA